MPTNIRHAVRAGTFYESSPASCEHHAQKLLAGAEIPSDFPLTVYGGIVPHAGWMYSGGLSALTLASINNVSPLKRVVLFGADHVGTVRLGEVFDSGIWRTPLGEVGIDDEIASAILKSSSLLRANPRAHSQEHSLEVQVPLLQTLNPDVKIIPIGVPPSSQAVEIGQAVGKILAEKFPDARVIGSTDLTHHGGHFGSPGGRGEAGRHWSEQNDRRMIDLILAMQDEKIVEEAMEHENACGAGAIAATISACKAMGADRGILLDYTNSYRVIHSILPGEPDDTTVGYASIVFA